MTVQTASTGALGLNNSGDSVTLNDGSSDVAMASYGSEGGDNQSLTLDPDVTGTLPYVKHSVATGSGGTLFSPGTRIDGASFSGCPSAWVINEFLADPASGSAGDANGDGTRSFSEDEFVEIVNDTGSDVDISGLTLSVGVGTWALSGLKFQADMGILLGFMFLANMAGAVLLLPSLAYILWQLPGRRHDGRL